jgi:hypothetical protein
MYYPVVKITRYYIYQTRLPSQIGIKADRSLRLKKVERSHAKGCTTTGV